MQIGRRWWLVLCLIGFAVSGQAQTMVEQTFPAQVNLQPDNMQIPVILRGSGLNKIVKVEAWYNNKPDPYIFAMLGPASSNRATVTLIARPGSPSGSPHQLRLTLEDNTVLNLPATIYIVAMGDPNAATPTTAAEQEVTTNTQDGRKVVVSNKMPVVTATIPSPLYVVPNGKLQTLVFKGVNLDSIGSVRMRLAAAPPRYRNREGELTFRKIANGLEVDVVIDAGVPIGTKYCIDLLLEGNYLAGTLTFPADNPPPVPVAPPVATAVNPPAESAAPPAATPANPPAAIPVASPVDRP